MSLKPGAHIAHFEVLRLIGKGGMGEVYQAKDTRLDRTVAIKVLPAHLSDSPELQQRFEREARLISSLNHPLICTLYEFGREDGIDFLVMEYLEGETLAERLKRGPLPLAEALRYAIEIAEALVAAHRQGVVHRDLKPGNIMLTATGVKLLDFGLAKLKASVALADVSSLSALPTQEQPLTDKGTVLGTFQYMAPEQLEEKDCDPRADIFAFGAVLYEMVTGKKAFEGKSRASLIAAILSSEPPAMKVLEPTTPPALDRTLKRCLAKEPDARWQTALDLQSELEWIAEAGSAPVTLELPEPRPKRREPVLGLAAFIVGSLVTGVAVWKILQPAPPPLTRLAVTLPAGQGLVMRNSSPIALSPDGRTLVYAARTEKVGDAAEVYALEGRLVRAKCNLEADRGA